MHKPPSEAAFETLVRRTPPSGTTRFTRFREDRYLRRNAERVRQFFFDQIAKDTDLSTSEKRTFRTWLYKISWERVLKDIADEAYHLEHVEKQERPVILAFSKEYRRLFECHAFGDNPRGPNTR